MPLPPPSRHTLPQPLRHPSIISHPAVRPRNPSRPPRNPLLRQTPLRRPQNSSSDIDQPLSIRLLPTIHPKIRHHTRATRPAERPLHVLRRLERLGRPAELETLGHGGGDAALGNTDPCYGVDSRLKTAVVAGVYAGRPLSRVNGREPGFVGFILEHGGLGAGDSEGDAAAVALCAEDLFAVYADFSPVSRCRRRGFRFVLLGIPNVHLFAVHAREPFIESPARRGGRVDVRPDIPDGGYIILIRVKDGRRDNPVVVDDAHVSDVAAARTAKVPCARGRRVAIGRERG
ncbi:hypothetical protein CMEL01_16468 [Colletotrichum melonis]|uniref:Uncharacterized protein n=1 Tax=Colletotrichum melonis TaxID=1209925 RepID=A0AAI9UDQ2_9PEZI|nr:hypothetical protein CMEL01_16468 [Colletotrichum melonis]